LRRQCMHQPLRRPAAQNLQVHAPSLTFDCLVPSLPRSALP
jgi:hypothetical protein